MIKQVLISLLLLLVLGSAHAQTVQPFSQLAPEMQRVLMPFEKEWATLDAPTQQRLIRGAERWIGMSTDQRTQAAKRLAWWRSLPPQRQAQIRQSLAEFKNLPPEQQQRIRQTFNRFKNLPPEQRAALMERFQRMSASEREAFMLGARANGGIPWRQLWGAIPREEIRPTIAMTMSLSPALRQRLAQLVERTPMAERSALRQRLVAMGFAEREAFLQAQ
jgi:Protein of unknown function (DUF3106)